jgi:hypothetical protein
MKKALLIGLLFSLFISNELFCQQASTGFRSKDYFVMELGGHGALYSLNYERLVFNNSAFKTSLQAGFTYYSIKDNNYNTIGFPLSINQLFSKKNHHLEMGVGMLLAIDKFGTQNTFHAFPTAKIGYRYQNSESPFIYKAAFTPVFNFAEHQNLFTPWAMVGIGYQFGLNR